MLKVIVQTVDLEFACKRIGPIQGEKGTFNSCTGALCRLSEKTLKAIGLNAKGTRDYCW